MKLASTRNPGCVVGFQEAVLHSLPPDGGLYQPVSEADLRPWILYLDETKDFASVAGTLTSALLKDELSPAICERLAFKAFSGLSPVLRELEEDLHLLELFHTPSGTHQDFGAMWLASALEHILTIRGKNATVLASAAGPVAASLGAAFAGKKHIRLVLVCASPSAGIPLDPAWLVQNGGNVLAAETAASVRDVRRIVREVYADPVMQEKYALTLANTANIGRLLPQIFFYMFAFSRLRKKTRGDIFYAVPSGNCANLTAGLYAWKYSLPVNGFITDASPALPGSGDRRQTAADAEYEIPSNLERLDQVFVLNPLLRQGFVFPFDITESEIHTLRREVRQNFGVWLDRDTAKAFAAAMEFRKSREEEGSVVVFANDDPGFSADEVRAACGDAPELSPAVRRSLHSQPVEKLPSCDAASLRKLLESRLPPV